MKNLLTNWRCGALALALLYGPATSAQQPSYPDQPIQLVVGFSAGGPADTIARTLAQPLGEALGTTIVIVNRPGADGVIAAGSVARATPDGYTLLLAPSTLAINASLYNNLTYDTATAFAPITLLGESPNIIAVHPSLPVHNIHDLVSYAKAREGQLFYGSTSSVTLLATEMLKMKTGIDMQKIPYKGAGQAIPALVSGQVQTMISSLLTMLPQVQAGRVRALAVTSPQRVPIAPDIPTVAEQGLADYSASTWYGLFAPAGTPVPHIQAIDKAMKAILRNANVTERLAQQGMIMTNEVISPEQFNRYLQQEIDKWQTVVKASSIAIN